MLAAICDRRGIAVGGEVASRGKKGELYHRYERGLENQLGALGLVLNCVVLWATVYLDAAVRQLKAQGYPVRDEDMARLSCGCRQCRHLMRPVNTRGSGRRAGRVFGRG